MQSSCCSKHFFEYLQTDDAMEVFEKYGFAHVQSRLIDDAEETDEIAEETEDAEETK